MNQKVWVVTTVRISNEGIPELVFRIFDYPVPESTHVIVETENKE